MAGIAIHDFDPQTNQEQELVDVEGERHPARVWFDVLTPTTAQVLATYGKGYYAGQAAITINDFGSGAVVYVGTDLASAGSASKLINFLAQGKISAGPSLPEGVEFAVREKQGKQTFFLINYTEKAQKVTLDRGYQNALTGETEPAEVQLPAFDVKILTTP
jgi:beta-galactosidase